MQSDPAERSGTAPRPHQPCFDRRIVAIAAISGLLAVLIGAFGAHGLESFLDSRHSLPADAIAKRIEQFDTGARYHLAHSVALLALGGLIGTAGVAFRVAAGMMMAGIVLFSGSLYLLVATNTPALGAITPIGGVLWIIAWGTVAVAAIRSP